MLFHYLQAVTAMGRTKDGWASASQEVLRGFARLDTKGRRRGLLALEALGLAELRQEGRKAYRARLLYQCAAVGERANPRTEAERTKLREAMQSTPNSTAEILERLRRQGEAHKG